MGTRWLDADERAAWLAMAALATRLPAALDRQLERDHGLSLFEYFVLAMLSEEEDRSLQMSDLAAMSSSSLSRLSHTAARLERRGLLSRARCPGRGRRTVATLTDQGHAVVVSAAPGHVEAVRAHLIDLLSDDDLRALRRIGDRVVAHLDSAEVTPSPDGCTDAEESPLIGEGSGHPATEILPDPGDDP